MTPLMLIIILAAFFVLLGLGIKYGKMHYLIAGYNQMSPEEKSRYDTEGIASVFRNGCIGMAALMLVISLIPLGINPEYVDLVSIMVSVVIGTTYLLVMANSKKYRKTDL